MLKNWKRFGGGCLIRPRRITRWLKYRVVGLIETLYVPGTDDKIFSDGDYDALMASPAGGPIELLSIKCSRCFRQMWMTQKKIKK